MSDLARVEDAVRAHEDIEHVAVSVVDGTTTAYLTATRDIGSEEVRTFAATRLSADQVPEVFVQIPTMPQTPEGEIDRERLADIDLAAQHERPPYVAARTDHEQQVAHAWAELLDVRPVGAHDDFFQLGGHSIMVIELATLLEGATGRRVPLSELFAATTVEGQARLLAAPEENSPARLTALPRPQE